KIIAAVLAASFLIGPAPVAYAQSTAAAAQADAPSGADPWPRKMTVQGAALSIYQPQLESWTGNLLDAYAAVTIRTAGSAVTNYGVVWFTARTEVDKVNRVVTLADFSVTKQNFPTLANNGAAYKSAFQSALPWNESMPLDELETALSTTSVDQQQRRVAVENAPPRIIVSTTPAVLVPIEGQPILRPATEGFLKVINTKALILADASTNTYYLALMDGWVRAPKATGPWSLAAPPPAAIATIRTSAIASEQNQVIGNEQQSLSEAFADGEAPAIFVSTTPTELLNIRGAASYASIP